MATEEDPVPAEAPSRSAEARRLALAAVAAEPGVSQGVLVERLREETGLAGSTVVRILQALEREGELTGSREGRTKNYRPAGARANGGRPEEEVADETAPLPPVVSRGSHGQLVAIVSAIFLAAAVVAFVLAPDNADPLAERGEPQRQVAEAPPPEPAPAPEPEPEPTPEPEPKPEAREPEPDPKPKPEPKPRPEARPATGGLAAAKRTRVAVLSGLGVPGIAARTGKSLDRAGFRVGTVANAPGPSDRSFVLFTSGKRAAAKALAKRLKIGGVRAVDANTRAVAPKDGLIVLLGADRG